MQWYSNLLQGLLDSIQYQMTPAAITPELWVENPEVYGQIE